jgi:hypothetical protein
MNYQAVEAKLLAAKTEQVKQDIMVQQCELDPQLECQPAEMMSECAAALEMNRSLETQFAAVHFFLFSGHEPLS